MSKADNRQLGGVAPSEYRSKMAVNADEIRERSLVPESLWSDDFRSFLPERVKVLDSYAQKLIA